MDFFVAFFEHMSIGFSEAISLQNLAYAFAGVFLGTLVGVLPGLGALVAITLLLPLTFYLPPIGSLILLAGIYFGADYGGGTCSILLGVPGHPAAAITCLDGYPMAKQGRGGQALMMKCIASFIGSSVGILALMFLAPIVADFALQFGPEEMAALVLLGLFAASTVGRGSPLKGVAMMIVGLIFGTVGTDVTSGVVRFDFGIVELSDGLSLIPIAMGIFAVVEVVRSAGRGSLSAVAIKYKLRDQVPTKEDWRRSWPAILRGSSLGTFLGALPGTSGGMATFVSYALEKRFSKHSKELGSGAIEGVAGPEAANNAGVGSAFIPTLTLGIPGDATMALLLAAMIIHGIQPGPQVMTGSPDLFWGLIVAFWIANIMLIILNIPLIGMWVRLLQIPYQYVFPAIILFTCIGVYSAHNSAFDIYILILFGVLGCVFVLLNLEPVPLILGLVLGPALEENFMRALLISGGDYSVFITSPISGGVLAIITLILIMVNFRKCRSLQNSRKTVARRYNTAR